MSDWLQDFSDSTEGAVCITFLALLGLAAFVKAVYRLLDGIWVYFLRPGKHLKAYGDWAVVTGATDGIGRAYAEALAKRGMNILLVSRTASKLEEVSEALQTLCRVETRHVAVDFAKATGKQWAALAEALEGLDIGILVNNVGLSYDHAEFFDRVDEHLAADIVVVNISATNAVTKMVLPGMVKRRRGAVVNIGTAVSIFGSGALYSVYAGSKAYVDMFSRSLQLEYPFLSIHNQAPAFVATRMSRIRRPRLDAPSPKRWVASAINHIGYESTQSPYWVHGFLWAVAHSLPRWAVDAYITRGHLELRRKYYQKLARTAEAAKQQ